MGCFEATDSIATLQDVYLNVSSLKGAPHAHSESCIAHPQPLGRRFWEEYPWLEILQLEPKLNNMVLSRNGPVHTPFTIQGSCKFPLQNHSICPMQSVVVTALAKLCVTGSNPSW
ncbi:hypothetical protein VNO77_19777 [Canavalia gladiata]|uniref:Uncharacterized protein n=1 Tax=Canavalia gladiata TaxID=3824 RepID=A0AAN9LP10_CANGL